ncbi:hypothetical protein IW492_07755 [Enterococcus sp. BWB1-3]|uniref:hypothetical protein n=1 Tax=unclassified Enterococcus TaxID=2608891 RepID=UPI0019222CE0|nr:MULTISPECIES: hypothetical protein [unclassified Enterococcus]MBL1229127.1 hypothetical protein [Enterococcus sp. BWB1-3]MCB5952507.1 hypothetical protein [Enterococcus sp. BWT-B8]MCB5953452.1 hypothetical protein [Enterococcus sp. CWB-B31]
MALSDHTKGFLDILAPNLSFKENHFQKVFIKDQFYFHCQAKNEQTIIKWDWKKDKSDQGLSHFVFSEVASNFLMDFSNNGCMDMNYLEYF